MYERSEPEWDNVFKAIVDNNQELFLSAPRKLFLNVSPLYGPDGWNLFHYIAKYGVHEWIEDLLMEEIDSKGETKETEEKKKIIGQNFLQMADNISSNGKTPYIIAYLLKYLNIKKHA